MEPVIVHIRPPKAMVLGLVMAVICLFFLGFIALGIWASATNPVPYWVAGAGLAVVGPLAVFNIGIALRRPVALRMDARGISGYYTAPATWAEIKRVDLTTGQKGHKMLSFELRDPIAFRDQQTSWQRLNSWASGATGGYHIYIPEVLLKDADMTNLTRIAQHFHAEHSMAPNPHADVT